VHWSKLPQAHALLADSIDPRLNERNLIWFLFRQYLLAPLFPRFGTHQLGRLPSRTPQSPETKLATPPDAPLTLKKPA
jgi:hypothetical protein